MKQKTPTQAEFLAIVRNHFTPFLEKGYAELYGDGLLINWHLLVIAYQLERLTRGEIRKLIITLPPRYLKSLSVTVCFVAWLLGRDPSLNIICASYSKELTEEHALLCRTVMNSEWFRALFPAWEPDPTKYTLDNQRTSAMGGRRSVSTGGTLTGLGADVLIIDDPISAGDALSEVKRQACIGWYEQVAASRLNDKATARQIVIQQRVHEDDLVGHLLEKGGWEHLNLPAIAPEDMQIPIAPGQNHLYKEGSVLHPEREPMSVLESIRKDMGSTTFATQYLQAPMPVEGNIIKEVWFTPFKLTRPLPQITRKPGDILVHSWDTALSTSNNADYSACLCVLFRSDGRSYILDVRRVKYSPHQLQQFMLDYYYAQKADSLLIERCTASYTLIDNLMQKPGLNVLTDDPKGSKLERLVGVSPYIEAGHVCLPREAAWKPMFLKELLGFPNMKHDDMVDALSMYLKWVRNIGQFYHKLPSADGDDDSSSDTGSRVTIVYRDPPPLSVDSLF